MTWDEKVEMVTAFNNDDIDVAVKIFSDANEWDSQALNMFLNSFNILQIEKLLPIKERFIAINVDDIGWRAQVRFDVMKQKLEDLS